MRCVLLIVTRSGTRPSSRAESPSLFCLSPLAFCCGQGVAGHASILSQIGQRTCDFQQPPRLQHRRLPFTASTMRSCVFQSTISKNCGNGQSVSRKVSSKAGEFLPNFKNKSSLGRCGRCAPPTSAPPLRLLVIRAICTHAYHALSPRSLMDVVRGAWAVSVLTRYIAARSLHSGVAHTGRDKSAGRKNITTCALVARQCRSPWSAHTGRASDAR
jgi:hypothetical protein